MIWPLLLVPEVQTNAIFHQCVCCVPAVLFMASQACVSQESVVSGANQCSITDSIQAQLVQSWFAATAAWKLQQVGYWAEMMKYKTSSSIILEDGLYCSWTNDCSHYWSPFPRDQDDILKSFSLFDQQYKTQRYLIYNIKIRKAENPQKSLKRQNGVSLLPAEISPVCVFHFYLVEGVWTLLSTRFGVLLVIFV